MRSLLVTALVLGGLFVIGCNPAPAKKSPGVEVDVVEPPSDSDENASTAPTAPGSNDSPAETPTAEAPAADPAEDPTTPPATPGEPQTTSCTSQADGNKSVTQVTFVDTNGHVTVSSMSVTVTNKGHRNKNDVDVYVTPSGGTESHQFNSGDILSDTKTVAVPLPNAFGVTTGSRIRVETNFDDSFGDPTSSCYLQF